MMQLIIKEWIGYKCSLSYLVMLLWCNVWMLIGCPKVPLGAHSFVRLVVSVHVTSRCVLSGCTLVPHDADPNSCWIGPECLHDISLSPDWLHASLARRWPELLFSQCWLPISQCYYRFHNVITSLTTLSPVSNYAATARFSQSSAKSRYRVDANVQCLDVLCSQGPRDQFNSSCQSRLKLYSWVSSSISIDFHPHPARRTNVLRIWMMLGFT